jgi:hydrophobic/amphiphilic exporter-1 (mainly G- bacteria), HAE1 family
MNLVSLFLNNPVKVSVGVLLTVLFGTVALLRMPMQLTPEVQRPVITIQTRWPGASPQEIEREIVQEQEEQLQSVEGVIKMTSESSDSVGKIILEFTVATEMNEALLKVNSRLQQVPQYPIDADQPVITASNSADRPIAWFILSQRNPSDAQFSASVAANPELRDDLEHVRQTKNPGLQMLRLSRLAKNHPSIMDLLPPKIDVPTMRRFTEDVVEARFERVSGVATSNVLGGREDEMQIIIDPRKLAARNLTVQNIREALRGRNIDTSAGDFWEGKRRYVVRTLGRFRNIEQVESVIIARLDGSPVYIRDVADVHLGHKKAGGLVRRFGTTNIAVNVVRQRGANTLDVMAGLREAADKLNNGVLKSSNLVLTQVYDETDYILSAVDLVVRNIYVGGLLTIGVLLLFLRSARSTLVVGLAIPTSILGAFIVLGLLGRSLNVVSLAGMAFAVGMLVDNAVVVLENIFRHYQAGESRMVAAAKGTQEVWGAVLTSTLTTLAVFVPVLFVQEEAGHLFRDIALAISAGVAISLIVSVSVIPTSAAKLLRKHHNSSGPSSIGAVSAPTKRRTIGQSFVNVVVATNERLLSRTSTRLATVATLVGVSAFVSYLLMPAVEYLPAGNRNLVFAVMIPPPGYNLDELTRMGERVETMLQPHWDVDNDEASRRGRDKPPVIKDFFYVATGKTVFMGVRAEDPARASELVPMLRAAGGGIPGTFTIAKQTSLFEQGLSAGRTIDVEITGPDLTKLVAIGGRIMGQVRGVVPDAQVRPKPSLDLSNPEVHIKPKWEQCADMRVTARDLGYAVNALVDGAYAGDYFLAGKKIDLTIKGREDLATHTHSLDSLPIATPSGNLVALAALATIDLGAGPEQINHRQRQRAITIEVSPPNDVPLEQAMFDIESQIVAPLRDNGDLEGGYYIALAGTADKLRATWAALRVNIGLALLITYLLMAALFESWLYPAVIILSVPLGAVGAFIGLAFVNLFVLQPLDVLTMLGFVILIGTVVNNPILIIHQALNHIREGMPRREAILESVRTRVRPIFMTTSTTVLGLCPLVIFPGAGSELYRGLGSVVLGGLLFSSIFTLFLVPALFSLLIDAREAFARRLAGKPLIASRSQPASQIPTGHAELPETARL